MPNVDHNARQRDINNSKNTLKPPNAMTTFQGFYLELQDCTWICLNWKHQSPSECQRCSCELHQWGEAQKDATQSQRSATSKKGKLRSSRCGGCLSPSTAHQTNEAHVHHSCVHRQNKTQHTHTHTHTNHWFMYCEHTEITG